MQQGSGTFSESSKLLSLRLKQQGPHLPFPVGTALITVCTPLSPYPRASTSELRAPHGSSEASVRPLAAQLCLPPCGLGPVV